jgi:hypothetical protein
MSRYYLIKGVGFALAVFHTTKIVVQPIVRKVTGWEDYETHEVNQKNIDNFIKKQENKAVTPVPPENENYF